MVTPLVCGETKVQTLAIKLYTDCSFHLLHYFLEFLCILFLPFNILAPSSSTTNRKSHPCPQSIHYFLKTIAHNWAEDKKPLEFGCQKSIGADLLNKANWPNSYQPVLCHHVHKDHIDYLVHIRYQSIGYVPGSVSGTGHIEMKEMGIMTTLSEAKIGLL